MNKRLIVLNSILLILFVCDRIIKYWFLKNPSTVVGGDFLFGLQFRFAQNDGIAFGVDVAGWLLIPLSVIIIGTVVWLLLDAYRRQAMLEIIAFSTIVAGAVSNGIDRLKYGFVIDYIDVSWFTVLNIADCLITVGALGLAYLVLIQNKKSQPPSS